MSKASRKVQSVKGSKSVKVQVRNMSYGAFGVKPQVQTSFIRANDGRGPTGLNDSAWGSGHRVCGSSGSSGRPNGGGLGGREGTNDVSPPLFARHAQVACPPLTTPAQDAHSHKPYGPLWLPQRGTIFSAFIGR